MEPTIFYPWTLASAFPSSNSNLQLSTSPRSSLSTTNLQPYAVYRLNSIASEFDFSDASRRGSFLSEDGSDSNSYAAITPDQALSRPPEVRRARGRPRKYPIAAPDPNGKPAKSRSKTGCWTCRKRKKKVRSCQRVSSFTTNAPCSVTKQSQPVSTKSFASHVKLPPYIKLVRLQALGVSTGCRMACFAIPMQNLSITSESQACFRKKPNLH